MADLIGYEFSIGWKECIEMVSTIALWGQRLENGGMGFPTFGIIAGSGCGKFEGPEQKCGNMFKTGIDITLDGLDWLMKFLMELGAQWR